MEIEKLKQKVKEFDQKAGFDKTEFLKMIEMFDTELSLLRSSSGDKKAVNHQLTDLLVLIMQVANRYNTNFDIELSKWFEKSQKYIK